MPSRPAPLRDDAPAKINLTLAVGPLRTDGFHPIESLIARISLCDTLTLSPSDGGFRLTANDPGLPTDETNLVIRAARAIAETAGISIPDVHIHLEKHIPAGAGLGGGSSDAATTLRLLEDFTGTALSPAQRLSIAASLGSDVPLFLNPSPCVARGRGEQVEVIQAPLTGHVVLLQPEIHCSTREIYAELDRHSARPIDSGRLQRVLSVLPDVDALMPLLFNDLEPPAFTCFPELQSLHARAQDIAEGPVRMSGSGSSLFRVVADQQRAATLAKQMRAELKIRCAVFPFAPAG